MAFRSPFATVSSAGHSAGEAQVPLQQIAEEVLDRYTVLGHCLSEAQHAFVALCRHAHSDNHLLPGNALALLFQQFAGKQAGHCQSGVG